MGRVIVSVALSVDGYTEGSGGDVSVMPLDESFVVDDAERVRGADTLLYGAPPTARWRPAVSDNPAASEAEQGIARRCVERISMFAVYDSFTEEDTGPWRERRASPDSQAVVLQHAVER